MKKQKLRKFWAGLRRTFVTTCPKCHEIFYGTSKYGKQVEIDGVHYRYVCAKCVEKFIGKPAHSVEQQSR